MLHPGRRYAAAATTALVLALGATGCGGGSPSSAPSSSAPPAPAQQAVATQVKYGAVTGRLSKQRRARLAQAVTVVVERWWDAAYLGGAYPRAASSFKDAFPGFTTAAAADAARKPGMMTNADLSAKVDGVEPLRKVIALDPLAVKGRPVGVTARVLLTFRTTGQHAGKEVVLGSLSLTPEKGKWRVFAFDITKRQTRGGGK